LQNILGKPRYQVKQERILTPNSNIISQFYTSDGFTTNLEKTQVVSLLYDFYQDDIDNISTMKMLSDCQFVETVVIIQWMALFYILFMVVPFIVQLYQSNQTVVIVCMSLNLVCQIFLFGLEML